MAEQAELMERIAGLAADLGIDVSPSLLEGCRAHAALVERWQARVRLVGDARAEALAARHYVDALTLTLVPGASEVTSGVDLGSGAGFPGLVLALAWPRTTWTLVESDGRKAAFLNAAVAKLGLAPRVRVVVARACGEPEEEEIGRASLVVARAVWGPPEVMERMAPYRSSEGRLATFSGPKEGAAAELAARAEALGLERVGTWSGEIQGAGWRRVDLWGRSSGGAPRS